MTFCLPKETWVWNRRHWCREGSVFSECSRSRQDLEGCFPHSCRPCPPQGRWGSGSAVELGTAGHCALGRTGGLAQQGQGSWGSKHSSCSLFAMLLLPFFLSVHLFSLPYLMFQWFFPLSLPFSLPHSHCLISSSQSYLFDPLFKHPLVLLFPLTRDGWRSQPDQ